jgi:hypothetical protein
VVVKERSPDVTTAWTAEQLEAIGDEEEIEIASRRSDGSLRGYTRIWVVRLGTDLFVRSGAGRTGHWFTRALENPKGQVRAAGTEFDVVFEEPQDASAQAIDEAYRAKYARYPGSVESMTNAVAAAAPLRLLPG